MNYYTPFQELLANLNLSRYTNCRQNGTYRLVSHPFFPLTTMIHEHQHCFYFSSLSEVHCVPMVSSLLLNQQHPMHGLTILEPPIKKAQASNSCTERRRKME
jgi:hypothetical protein